MRVTEIVASGEKEIRDMRAVVNEIASGFDKSGDEMREATNRLEEELSQIVAW